MKTNIRKLLLLLGLGASFSMLGAAAHAADLTIRMAWYMPPHTAVDKQGNAVAEAIESMSDGKIKVETYPSGSLLKSSNIAQGLVNNTANMGIAAMHWWSKYEPALEWDTIPFLVEDAPALLKALHGKLGDEVNGYLEKHGVHIVGWGFYGYAENYINAKHAVKVPADLKGLKLRSDGKLSSKFLSSQGATPVAMDSSEVYTALQRGSLDGASSGISSFISRKWYEVAHYLTAIRYAPLVYPVQVNAKWWKGLTDDQRDIISKAVASTEGMAVDNINQEFEDNIAIAKKNGNEVYQPSDADLQKWKDVAGPFVRKAYVDEVGESGQRILDDIQASLGK